MKKMKRWICTLLVLVSLFGFFPPLAQDAEAKEITKCSGSDFFPNNSVIASRLDTMFAGDIGLYDNQGLTKKVNAALGTYNVPNKDGYWHYWKICKNGKMSVWSGNSCFAYANAFYGRFYNDYTFPDCTNSSKNHEFITYPGGKVNYNNFKKWGVRDDAAVYVWVPYGENGHAIIVLTYDENYLTYVDGNGDGQGYICVRKESWKNLSTNLTRGYVGDIVQPKESFFSACEHESRTSLGVCTECGDIYNYNADRVPISGSIMSNGGTVRIYEQPYAASTLLSSSNAAVCYTVTGKVVNWHGVANPNAVAKHTWYEISYKGEKAYVFCDKTTASWGTPYFELGEARVEASPIFQKKSTSGTKLSSMPVSISKGTKVYLSGTLASTNEKISAVTVGIYNRDGTAAKTTSSKKCVYTNTSVNSYTFDLADADCGNLVFSGLAAGNYTFKIMATVDGEKTTVKSYDFVVQNGNTASAQYNVTLNANGGSFSGNKSTNTATVTKGNSVYLSNYTPTRSGYTFLGWDAASNSTSPDYGKSSTYKPTSSVTLYAIWEEITAPATPSLTQKSLTVGQGDAATVSWWSSSGADNYTVTFYDSEGTEYFTANTVATSASAVMQEAGEYTVTVKASNVAGESAESRAASITVIPPSTVTFLNYDGSVWSTQNVGYGGTAVAPAEPSRMGYEFTGWDGDLYNVKSERTLTATYSAIGYDVTFYDYNGKAVSTQTVYYNGDTPGSAVAPSASALNAPDGYVLAGWDTDAWQNVTRNGIKVYPCFVWENEDLPIETAITSVTKAGNGYWVFYTIENHVESAQQGRVVVVLKSGFGKFLTKTESGAFYLEGNSTYNGNLYVPLDSEIADESFATVEAYVVNSYTSLVPISSVAQIRLLESDDSDWSAWMTEEEYAAYTGDKSETQTRTEYSTRTRSVSDWITNDSYLDWALLDSRTVLSDWSSWSDWSTDSVTEDTYTDVENRKVETAAAYTQYRYGRYISTSAGTGTDGDYYSKGWGHFHQSYYKGTNWKTDYTSWSTKKVSPSSTNCYYWATNNSVNTGKLKNGNYYWNKYLVNSTSYYWQETRTVPATYAIQFRYRTCTDITEYQFYSWSDWSDWSTTEATDEENLEVQTRTMYRVKLPISEAGDGETISGTLSVPGISDLAGRQVILNIYKVDEASDYSNEYIAQGVLGANGEYSFTGIHTYENPTVKTGDFTVTLTIEGSTGPMVLETDLFKAPKPEYTVTFVDGITGKQIGETQEVTEGEAASAPEVPEKEGYTFLGWEYGLTNIRDNMIIHARYAAETYTIVYVDWANSTVSMQTDVAYGTALTDIADPPAREGYTFLGWAAEDSADINCVTRSMIVTAQYEKLSYTVRFLDADGNVISEQTVGHGESAEEPEFEKLAIAEGMYMDSWSETPDCITGPVDIEPIVLYEADAAWPEASLESGVYDGAQTVELFADSENAVIFYRMITMSDVEDVVALDGAGEEDIVISGTGEVLYTEPLVLTESTYLEVTSSEDGTNSVTGIYEYIIVPESARPAAPETLTAEDFSDRIELAWSAVDGADGYIIDKTDIYGNAERFMTEDSVYTDTNVEAITEYTYTVSAYSIHTEGDAETYLISLVASPEASVRYYGEQYAVAEITVEAPETVLAGSAVQLGASVMPANAYNPSVSWTVADGTGSATITNNGILTATRAGTVTVTATANDGSSISDYAEINIVEPADESVHLKLTSAAVMSGKDASVSVMIGESSGITALQFVVLYDDAVLTLESASAGKMLGEQTPTINSEEPGKVYFVYDDVTELTESGELLKLVFTTGEVTESVYTWLSIPNEDEYPEFEFICATEESNKATCDIINGKISILNLCFGDINGDEAVNVLDVSMARKYSAKLLDLEDWQLVAGDVSGDGKVNIADVNLLRKYSAKLINTFPAEQD